MSIKTNEKAIKAIELVGYEDWRELVNSLCWESMEAILSENGNISYRMENSFGDNEDQIVAKIPLSDFYWRDTLRDWEIYDEDLHSVKENIDEDIVKDFIENNLKDSFLES